LCQKALDLPIEVVIAFATLLQKPEAFLRRALKDRVQEADNAPPAVRFHTYSPFDQRKSIREAAER
jgi:hypothetical protein